MVEVAKDSNQVSVGAVYTCSMQKRGKMRFGGFGGFWEGFWEVFWEVFWRFNVYAAILSKIAKKKNCLLRQKF